ncbi:hypothetical protein [Massilia horti]|uniref:Lipoprotein n=1 Tax=Massilia horti TaxID=2562153 RepID=A0A4Y9SQR6_9BURK|nr:hypothetical protein [Massilia horti]TFW29000.1 hypothetical protein E4O92_19720 [Massilia horti]
MKCTSFLREAAYCLAACMVCGCSSWHANEPSANASGEPALQRAPASWTSASGLTDSGTGSGPGPGSAAIAGSVGMGMPRTDGGAIGSSQIGATAAMPGPGRTDAARMCAQQRRLDSANTPEEREALINQFLPGMSAQMRDQHLQAMQQLCNETPIPGPDYAR